MIRKLAMAGLGLVDLALERVIPQPEHITRERIREMMLEEAGHYLTDIEWRYRQARDLVGDALAAGTGGNVVPIGSGRQITAEDINDLRHRLTGYTITNNVNAAGAATPGSIRWQALRIVYAGVDYAIADGATTDKFVWFVKPGSGTTATLSTGNTKPTLGADDLLVFINNAGIATVAASDGSASLPTAVGNGAVDFASLAAGAVSGDRIADTGIGANKLGTGAINLSAMVGLNVLAGDRLANGAIGSTQLGAGAVSPTKLNILSHVIY